MESFFNRHIGPSDQDIPKMLEVIGVSSVEKLLEEVVPNSIRDKQPFKVVDEISEYEYLKEIKEIAKKNQIYKSYIGMGYYNTILPTVIQRNIFENPSWYTSYTPYQAEISQGRLESLINFQTMVIDITGMDVANASLLDEATAVAEAMTLLNRQAAMNKNKRNANCFFVSKYCFPQTIDVLKTRSEPIGIELVIDDPSNFSPKKDGKDFFGAVLQFPLENGGLVDYTAWVEEAKQAEIFVAVATDLMSLILLKPPSEWSNGVDVVVGNTQRFGVPLGYGGPHAAFIATKDNFKRQLPGRIIGVSKDVRGKLAYRMSLQTREQHIRREKATSNICTAQALLANMAAMYAVFHGPDGIRKIAQSIHAKTKLVFDYLVQLGFKITYPNFFDTIIIELDDIDSILSMAENKKIIFRKYSAKQIGISLDEATTTQDIYELLSLFYEVKGSQLQGGKEEVGANLIKEIEQVEKKITAIPRNLLRESTYLTHPVFNCVKSETQMLRYIKQLEKKDISLDHSMIPLGSCTMKLNPTTTMMPLSWEEFSSIHPFVDLKYTEGYQIIFKSLEKYLMEITGMDDVSLQPNSGAQGEYAGLLAIKKYHLSNGEKRNIVLIPVSAHGTNPASANMAGMEVVLISCLKNGDIDFEDLKVKVENHKDHLAALMITYPSTHGIYEEKVEEICKLIHDNGGQVYMDGANMNAQIGITSPRLIGADVCHLNLHKTFAIPHGGGGPGMGPIAVKKHLSAYLPGHSLININGRANQAVAATPWGSSSILLISYAYIRMLGSIGLKKSTEIAILNANYLKDRLKDYYPILFQGSNNRVAHEFIIDIRPFEQVAGVKAEDITKRLMDYGFHAPTLSFPIPGTLMIEPSESEDKQELDRFCDTLIKIREEITKIENGESDRKNNLLKNAPHSLNSLFEEWNYPYTQQEAYFPLPFVKENKFWTPVSRIDNVYGDKNFFCACPS